MALTRRPRHLLQSPAGGIVVHCDRSAIMSTMKQRPGAPNCSSCRGSGECLACAGSGFWYRGTPDEDECSSCGGTGRCPDCATTRTNDRESGRATRQSDVLLLNFSYLIPNAVAAMGFPAAPKALRQLVPEGVSGNLCKLTKRVTTRGVTHGNSADKEKWRTSEE